ncbi:MAG: hypothetical protein H0V29_09025 [Thermoleophilaceae bacterium]|nr:hypothetical protein [Thermoleophilaceae bacterium]
MGRRLMTQAVKLSPVNLRPLLRIPPARNAKAIGLVASGYVRLHEAGADLAARRSAEAWLDWLDRHADRTTGEPGWGYHFDVQTRFFSYAAHTPNTIATAFVADAAIEAASAFESDRWAELAAGAARFLRRTMLADGPRPYFRYLAGEDEIVHNANLLAAAVLVRAGALIGDHDLVGWGEQAVARSVAAQRDDGSIPYSEGPAGEWVDNFHTAYVLESLAVCADRVGGLEGPLRRGYEYWGRELFDPDGTPRYYPDKASPLDAHMYGSAIDAWLAARGRVEGATERAAGLAAQLIEKMLAPDGHVYFQRRGRWTNRVAFVRWTTAPSFKALAGLLCARAQEPAR